MSFLNQSPGDQGIPHEVDVQAAAELLAGEAPPTLLDVREIQEREFCNLGEGLHIPTGEIQLKWQALPKDKHLLVYCHHGMRSLRVTRFLRDAGFENVQSLKGGIEAWSCHIDQRIPRY